MTIKPDWIVLDTNIWIFGLRKQPEYPACAQLLRQLYQWQIRVPRQILIELQANLSRDEVADLFRLLNHYPAQIDIRWDKAKPELVSKYQQLGCKLGDAAVAAHVEEMNIKILVSENRDFLQEIKGLPFQVLSAQELLAARE